MAQGYLLAWICYLAAALVAWLMASHLLRHRGRIVAWSLLGALLALLLAPMAHPLYPDWRVPAIMVLFLGTLSEGWDQAGVPALALLAAVTVMAALLGGGLAWWRQRRARATMLDRD